MSDLLFSSYKNHLEGIENVKRLEPYSILDEETGESLPIPREDTGKAAVVLPDNVLFEGGGKTYCYLCDDDLIQDGDEVLVPVGRDGELKSVIVDSVELHTAEYAPFPIDKCKKVVRRV